MTFIILASGVCGLCCYAFDRCWNTQNLALPNQTGNMSLGCKLQSKIHNNFWFSLITRSVITRDAGTIKEQGDVNRKLLYRLGCSVCFEYSNINDPKKHKVLYTEPINPY